ncbi:hypothetical protein ACQY1Q_07650 [Tenacibaculum sp. TC6]|uniref:hypothetical protein n=1 Tax=Tenacibaculum sp. TC6 TaxID=3423223 RepID=UPI003D360937
MKKFIYLFIYSLICNIHSQEKKETVYLLFDSKNKKTCIIGESNKYGEIVKKYRKEERKNRITFFICKESFVLDKKDKIDTCDIKYLNKIKFETLQTMESKRGVSKYVFKNSIFEKIYLVEKYKDIIIKYPVIWNTDSTQY